MMETLSERGGGFCPFCNIYWGGGGSVLVNKKDGGDSVRGGGRTSSQTIHTYKLLWLSWMIVF